MALINEINRRSDALIPILIIFGDSKSFTLLVTESFLNVFKGIVIRGFLYNLMPSFWNDLFQESEEKSS